MSAAEIKKANQAAFTAEYVREYNANPTLQAENVLISKAVLEFDPKLSEEQLAEKFRNSVFGAPKVLEYDTSVINPDLVSFEKLPESPVFDPAKKLKVLDFGCGSGGLGKYVAARCAKLVGTDISTPMLVSFNQVKEIVGLGDVMTAYQVDITEPPSDTNAIPAEISARDFDAAICSLAYHHILDIDAASRALADHVRPGGYVIIVDFLNEHPNETPQYMDDSVIAHAVPHKGGISKEQMRGTLEQAGLEDVKVYRCFQMYQWEPESWLLNHAYHIGVDSYDKLPQAERDGKKVYQVLVNFVLGAGRKPEN